MPEMDCARSIFETHCKGEFAELKADIREIKRSVTGNGAEGIMGRLTRQEERTSALLSWKKWIIGAFTILLTGIILAILTGR